MSDLKSATKKNTNLFLSYVKSFSDMSQVHHLTHKNGGFPIFLPDNREYYEQAFFDELIENAIWRFLVNDIFRDLFTSEYCEANAIVCEWANMHPQLTTSYVETIENRYPIEFIITKNEKREGYRYTNCYYDESRYCNLFNSKKLSRLSIIDFSSVIQSAFLHPLIAPVGLKEKIRRIQLKDFFSAYFSESEYDIYVSEVRTAVAEAYQHVGKQTITNLTFHHLPFFLKKVLDEVCGFPYLTTSYNPTKGLSRDARKWYGTGIISQTDKKTIKDSFENVARYRALIGRKDFARSFVTSEYLYQTLKNNNIFDYTAIVTGYFKSIEQLLYLILSVIENDGHVSDVWIQSTTPIGSDKYRNANTPAEFRSNPEKGKMHRTQVKVKPCNRNHYDTSFAALVYMLESYDSGWLVSKDALDIISALLLTYSSECRNDHLHKENIYNIAEIETIRSKTYLLLYYVLGGYDFSKGGHDSNKILGIIDNSFEKLYHKLMQFGPGNYYYLSFSDLSPILVAFPQQETPEYDHDGLIKNPSLRFVKLQRKHIDGWEDDDWGKIQAEMTQEKTVIIDRNRMPISVSYVNTITGEIVDIEW